MRFRILNIDDGSERKRAMGGREKQRIENLAVGGRPAGEFLAVPARDAVQIRLRQGPHLRSSRAAVGSEDERKQRHPEPRRRRRTSIQDDGHTRTSAVPRVMIFADRIGSMSSMTKRSVCWRES